jgi:hypothetical protein
MPIKNQPLPRNRKTFLMSQTTGVCATIEEKDLTAGAEPIEETAGTGGDASIDRFICWVVIISFI